MIMSRSAPRTAVGRVWGSPRWGAANRFDLSRSAAPIVNFADDSGDDQFLVVQTVDDVETELERSSRQDYIFDMIHKKN